MKVYNFHKEFALLKFSLGKSAVIICFVLAFHVSSFAHQFELFSLDYEFFPSSHIEDPAPGVEDVEIQVSTFQIRATLPLIFDERKTILLNGFRYQQYRFDQDYLAESEEHKASDDLHALTYNLTVVRQFSPKWKVVTMVVPGIFTNEYESVDSQDFDIQGSILFNRILTTQSNCSFGLAYINSFGEPLLTPALGYRLDKEKYQFNLLIPTFARFSYAINGTVSIGLSGGISGDRFHIESEVYDDEYDNIIIKYSAFTLGPVVDFTLKKSLHVAIEGGLCMGLRRFEFYDGDDELADRNMENNVYFRTKIYLKPSLKE